MTVARAYTEPPDNVLSGPGAIRTQSGTRLGSQSPARGPLVDRLIDALRIPALDVGAMGEVSAANVQASFLLSRGRPALIEKIVSAARRLEGGDGIEVLHSMHSGVERRLVLVHDREAIEAVRVAQATDAWKLTRRQAEVLRGIAQGCSNKQIAAMLDCTDPTVELHVTAILRKVGVRSRTELLVALFHHFG